MKRGLNLKVSVETSYNAQPESGSEFKALQNFREDNESVTNAGNIIKTHFTNIEGSNYKEENLSIEMMSSEKGVNLHFVLFDQVSEKKFHIKTSLSHMSSCGTKYNEVLMYKILENFGFGPKDSSAMINYSGTSATSDQNAPIDNTMNLMIITEDLSNTDPNFPNREFRFSTKEDAEQKNNAGYTEEMALYTHDPQTQEENIQKCCIALLSSVLGLRDVGNNKGNVGLQTITDETNATIVKPYIIDFKIDIQPSSIEMIADVFSTTDGLVEAPDDSLDKYDPSSIRAKSFNGSCFAFTLDQETRRESLKRIFGENGKNALHVINTAAANLRESFRFDNDTVEHAEILHNFYKERIARFNEFYERCKDLLQTQTVDVSKNNSTDSGEINMDDIKMDVDADVSKSNSTDSGEINMDKMDVDSSSVDSSSMSRSPSPTSKEALAGDPKVNVR